MEIRIFDVEHGFCAYVIGDRDLYTGAANVVLIDCGHNTTTGFRPSEYLVSKGCDGVELLIITNYDEDHVSDLPNLRRKLPITLLRRNRTMDSCTLEKIKRQNGPIGYGVESLIEMMRSYTGEPSVYPEFPDLTIEAFSNPYPLFEDTNNLSLVIFMHYKDIHIIFPGDLERAGWKELLKNNDFVNNLKTVNFFVASHHGRESGYCKEIFEICKPEVVIISDESQKYDTQKGVYNSTHSKGILFGDKRRHVLTTRSDGMITIRQNQNDQHAWINVG